MRVWVLIRIQGANEHTWSVNEDTGCLLEYMGGMGC